MTTGGTSGTETLAERIRSRLEETPFEWNGTDLSVTASLGVAESRADDGDVESVIDRADAALYEAKQQGRNCVVTSA